MQLTIVLPDELGQRLNALPDPDRFIVDSLKAALRDLSITARGRQPSRWAQVAERIVEDPEHLDGYSRELLKDAEEVRADFILGRDRSG